MRPLLIALCSASLAAAAACGPRQVEVRTAPSQPSAVSVRVNNTLTQAVNVYVRLGNVDTFVGQVGSKQAQTISVQGFATGSAVTLRAVTVDGTKTYSRDNVTLNGTFDFSLP
jgi:phage major head subunit gpT-like protein